jgi:hypothetical protein
MTNWRLSDIIRHVHEPDRSTRRTETNLLIILSTHFKLAHADWVGTSPIPTPTETLLRASPVFLLRLKLNGLARAKEILDPFVCSCCRKAFCFDHILSEDHQRDYLSYLKELVTREKASKPKLSRLKKLGLSIILLTMTSALDTFYTNYQIGRKREPIGQLSRKPCISSARIFL